MNVTKRSGLETTSDRPWTDQTSLCFFDEITQINRRTDVLITWAKIFWCCAPAASAKMKKGTLGAPFPFRSADPFGELSGLLDPLVSCDPAAKIEFAVQRFDLLCRQRGYLPEMEDTRLVKR